MTALRLKSHLARPGFQLDALLDLELDGVVGLFGPSGSGKTTLLRVIAGLEPASRGRVWLDDEAWQDDERRIFRPPHRRGTGFVFQDARLFPHLSVAANLRFALDRTPRAGRRLGFDEVVEVLDLGRLLPRRPGGLSGGETQRVAIGRALLTSPRLLLMDEPMASLDLARKAEILPYLDRLKDHVGLPTIYVTHNLDELVHLARRAVLIEAGRVLGVEPVASLFDRLALRPFTRRVPGGQPPAPDARSA
jgi:molybdate transport system ATP-binding protein